MQAAFPPPHRAPTAVGIIGGMGPAAGARFVQLFVEECSHLLAAAGLPVKDQSFPEHWLAQVPVPDRVAALQQPNGAVESPLVGMKRAAARLASLGAGTIAIACNTAHAWHRPLQESLPDVQLIHGVRETVLSIAHQGVSEVGLLATEGTYKSRLYDHAFAEAGVRCIIPKPDERAMLMEGIFSGVKAGKLQLARERFESVAHALVDRHGCSTLILGCTEIPLALTSSERSEVTLVDPAQVMARALAQRAYAVDLKPLAPE